MQDLTVIGVDNGALLVSSDAGTRYRIAINESLRSKVRQASPPAGAGRKLAPREIQAHIRSGMSAEDVAAVTGVDLEYIQKFEGPVLAEREFVIESALNVAVHTAIDPDPMSQGSTFGAVIRERLHDLGATGERWASWKEPDGAWVVKLAFTAEHIDHDARWHYEPRKAALAPINTEANTLSQQGEMPGALIPRLRAVGGDERALDSSRFDSGAFDVRQPRAGESPMWDTAPQLESVPFGRHTESSPEVSAAAINRAPAVSAGSSQTADLLEALRRRRGERESSASWEETDADDSARSAHPTTGGIRLIDSTKTSDVDEVTTPTAPQPISAEHPPAARSQHAAGQKPAQHSQGQHSSGQSFAGQSFSAQANSAQANSAQANSAHASAAQSGSAPSGSAPAKASARKGRAAMPSWDEIVFGARADDDLS